MSNPISRRIKLRRRERATVATEPKPSSQERAIQVWEGEGGEILPTKPQIVRTFPEGRSSM